MHAVASEITAAGGPAVVCEGDVAQWPVGEAMLAAALDAFGGLDILVNNAGVLRDRMIFTMSAEEWDLVLRVHLRGHFVTTRIATAYWREASKRSGGPVYARIVNTSSEAFLLGSPGQPNYAAAKAGIVALTVTTARSCARYGVLANAICPRARTDMTAELMGAPPEAAVDPLAPEHVAPLVVHLATRRRRGSTGRCSWCTAVSPRCWSRPGSGPSSRPPTMARRTGCGRWSRCSEHWARRLTARRRPPASPARTLWPWPLRPLASARPAATQPGERGQSGERGSRVSEAVR